MAVGDVATLRIVSRYQDQNVVNTLHYQVVTQTSDEKDILNDLCTAWKTVLESGFTAVLNDQLDVVGYKAFNKAGSATVPGYVSSTGSGGVVATGEPAFVNKTITFYTDSANYRRRGRMMLAGVSQGELEATDGSLSPTALTALAAFGASLLVTLSNGGQEWKLVIPATAALPVEEVTDIRARETPSVNRSRRIRQFLVG